MPGLHWKHDEMLQQTMHLLEHIAQCARRGQHGEWVVTLGEKTGDHRLAASFIDDATAVSNILALPPTVWTNGELHNQQQVDVAWIEQAEAAAAELSEKLDALVVLVCAHREKKAGYAVGGADRAGPQLEVLTKDVPRLLRTMAAVTAVIDTQTDKH